MDKAFDSMIASVTVEIGPAMSAPLKAVWDSFKDTAPVVPKMSGPKKRTKGV